MDSKYRLELYINKANDDIEDGNFDDAETILLEAKKISDSEHIISLLKKLQDAKASLVTEMSSGDTKIAEDSTKNDVSDQPETNSREPETIAEKEARMMRNTFIIRATILNMHIRVAAKKIQTIKSSDAITDTTKNVSLYRKVAKNAFALGQFEKANKALLKAEEVYSEMSGKLFPVRVRTEMPSNDYLRMQKVTAASNTPGLTVRGNKEDVVECLNKAKKAFSDGDFKKAEKWLFKSLRMCPTKNAQDLLSEVQKAISETEEATEVEAKSNEDAVNFKNKENVDLSNTVEAEKCFDAARKALASEDFDKSERLFKKAQRMNPSLDVDSFLKEIQAAKASRSSSEGARENSSESVPNMFMKDEADTYLDIAWNAYRDRNLDRAEKFLTRSVELIPDYMPAKDLQKEIEAFKLRRSEKTKKDIRTVKASTRYSDVYEENPCSGNIDESIEGFLEEDLRKEAELYVKHAWHAFYDDNLKMAHHLLMESVKLCPTEHAAELHKKINAASSTRCFVNSNCRTTSSSVAWQHSQFRSDGYKKNKEVHELYFEKAKHSFKLGCIGDAEHNALEARRTCPHYSLKINQLLKNIENAKRKPQKKINTLRSSTKDVKKNEVENCAATSDMASVEELQKNGDAVKIKNELAALIDTAIKSLDQGSLEIAEQNLQKAYALLPAEYIYGLLKEVEKKKAEEKSCDNTETYQNNETVKCSKFNGVSKGAIPKVVEGTKLKNPAKSNAAVNEKRLNEVESSNSAIPKTSDVNKNPEEPLTEEALIFLNKAHNAFNKADIENAQSFLIIAEKSKSSDQSRKLFIKLLKAKTIKTQLSYDMLNDVEDFKDKKYLSLAEKAYVAGEFKTAMDYVEKATSLRSSPYVSELYKKIASVISSKEMHSEEEPREKLSKETQCEEGVWKTFKKQVWRH